MPRADVLQVPKHVQTTNDLSTGRQSQRTDTNGTGGNLACHPATRVHDNVSTNRSPIYPTLKDLIEEKDKSWMAII